MHGKIVYHVAQGWSVAHQLDAYYRRPCRSYPDLLITLNKCEMTAH